MIYMFFIIVVSFILLSVIVTMNAHHGKISERPLRRKIIDDIANLLLFITVFCCSFFFINARIILLSLSAMMIVMQLFIHRKQVAEIKKKIFDIFRNKIAFRATIRNGIQRLMKNYDDIYKAVNAPRQREAVYRECILAFIVFFCKRLVLFVVFMLLIFWGIQDFYAEQKLLELYSVILDQKFVFYSLVIANNGGIIFTCWKFNIDYKAIQDENKSYNEQLERVFRKLERKEHDI